ncbi:PPP1R3C [Bugula neritina]|uniref:PPP1R3C n=1 Tax=Bugula neritina TaxID=10212 RepID=A0A7J7IWC3_BUGNE|nr:PPP1R3C [Bugula neritina]
MFLSPSINYPKYIQPYPTSYITDCMSSCKLPKHVDLHEQQSLGVRKSNLSLIKESTKKKVSFADSVGLDLVQVRHMTEGRDTPPNLSPNIFRSLEPDNKNSAAPSLALAFQQPASDYTKFTQSVINNSVSLENISLNGNVIVGTVGVKNIAFEKKVVVRFTYDNWLTSEDVPAHYINNGLGHSRDSGRIPAIDTFSFTHEVPTDKLTHHDIQFVVCYHCCGQEFWDNNRSKNYHINVHRDSNNNNSSPFSFSKHPLFHVENWTEFAIWKSLESDYSPYW